MQININPSTIILVCVLLHLSFIRSSNRLLHVNKRGSEYSTSLALARALSSEKAIIMLKRGLLVHHPFSSSGRQRRLLVNGAVAGDGIIILMRSMRMIHHSSRVVFVRLAQQQQQRATTNTTHWLGSLQSQFSLQGPNFVSSILAASTLQTNKRDGHKTIESTIGK